MKKYLLLASVAALAFTSCSDQSTEFVGDSVAKQAREISFAPLAKPTTRADAFTPVPAGALPDNYTLEVSASVSTSSAASDKGKPYFSDVPFSMSGTTWKGGQYWPLSPATLNFLAVTNWTTTPASVVSTSFTNAAQSASVTLGDNKPTDLTAPSAQTATQHDLMYAVGRGTVEQAANNTMTYRGDDGTAAAQPVTMVFKHALAWVNFTAKTAGNYTNFYLTSITLNGANYGGTYGIDNSANYDYFIGGSNTARNPVVTGAWSAVSNNANVIVPGWTKTALNTTATDVGRGLLVVPTNDLTTTDSFTGFTIVYEFNGQTFTKEFAMAAVLEEGKKYTYAITFSLTEIEIAPSVTGWNTDAANTTNVAVP